ncbi:hypothetical protein FTW19_17785 [Terriglobus albidus]|uniref:Uncharacterized protein n=1 Tax=Terriglobus albidus TaxID=1592106 RepID=A0A5B9EDF1_9BACT|nr:hypothetical protein [Terriglobus albidus]QEE29674.1 hypothetical protein FTW19_17785 [Terriglobus albidus]
MPTLRATFRSNYGESRLWTIVDQGRDPNSPPVIFNGYLEPNQPTEALEVYTDDGLYGKIAYQRSDGPMQVNVSVTDGSETAIS